MRSVSGPLQNWNLVSQKLFYLNFTISDKKKSKKQDDQSARKRSAEEPDNTLNGNDS